MTYAVGLRASFNRCRPAGEISQSKPIVPLIDGGLVVKTLESRDSPSALCCNVATPPSTLHSNVSAIAGISTVTSMVDRGAKRNLANGGTVLIGRKFAPPITAAAGVVTSRAISPKMRWFTYERSDATEAER